jgi:hypothetical protein
MKDKLFKYNFNLQLFLTKKSSKDFVIVQFECSLYELANEVAGLAKFYSLASDSYERSCTHLCNSIINLVCLSFKLGFYKIDFLSINS